MVRIPRLPTWPGAGLTSNGLPCESKIARLLYAAFNELTDVTFTRPGSGPCVTFGKKVGRLRLSNFLSCPAGNSPRMFGVLFVCCQMLARPPADSVRGAPELQRVRKPNCHCPTIRSTHAGAALRRARFVPNGKEYVPLPVMMCVLWKASSALSKRKLLGSRGERSWSSFVM